MKKSPPKKALWMSLRVGRLAAAKTAKAKAEKLAKKVAKKRAKPWKKIAPMGDRMKARYKEYLKARGDFLEVNRWCDACWKIEKNPLLASHRSSEVHHKNGRLGRLLTDKSHFISVCRTAHQWIGDNPEKARELGLLCQKGVWNKQP